MDVQGDELLAMGFAHRHVKDVIAHCSTMEEAVDWLVQRDREAPCSSCSSDETRGVVRAGNVRKGFFDGSPLSSVHTFPSSPSSSSASSCTRSSITKANISMSPESSTASALAAASAAIAAAAAATAAAESAMAAAESRMGEASARPIPTDDGSDGTTLDYEHPQEDQGLPEIGTDDTMNLWEHAATCQICVEEQAPWCAVRLPCGHGCYCATCIRRHAEARLGVGSHEVPCPECNKALDQATLRALLPPLLFERLLERSLEQAVDSSDDLWACPTPNCPNRVVLEDDKLARFFCELCSTEHCLRCDTSPFHDGLSCGQYKAKRRAAGERDAADQLRDWMKQTGTKQCPRCRIGISKQDLGRQRTQRAECHKMLCRNCGTRFCFQCLSLLNVGFTCGCTNDSHGFIDPKNGTFVTHVVGSARGHYDGGGGVGRRRGGGRESRW